MNPKYHNAYYNAAIVYKAQNKFMLARDYFLKAKALFKTNKDPKINQDISENLSENYAETNDFKNAYKYLVDANVARDSAFKIESQELTQDLLAKYETENES